MLQANFVFITSPAFLCPKLTVKSSSVSLGFSYRSQGIKLEFSKRVSRSFKKDAQLFSIKCSSSTGSDNSNTIVNEKSVSVILLAGGQGKRMKMTIPKQYIPLLGQPIALYSFFTFSRMPEVKEIVVVCDPFFRDILKNTKNQMILILNSLFLGKKDKILFTVDFRKSMQTLSLFASTILPDHW